MKHLIASRKRRRGLALTFCFFMCIVTSHADASGAQADDQSVEDSLVQEFRPLLGRFSLPVDEKLFDQALNGAAMERLKTPGGGIDLGRIDRLVKGAKARLIEEDPSIAAVVKRLKEQPGVTSADSKMVRFAADALLREKGVAVDSGMLDRVEKALKAGAGDDSSAPFEFVKGNKEQSKKQDSKPAEADKAKKPAGAEGQGEKTEPVLVDDAAKSAAKEYLKRTDEVIRTATGNTAVEQRFTLEERKAKLRGFLDDGGFMRDMASKLNLRLAPLDPQDKKTLEGLIDELYRGEVDGPGTASSSAEAEGSTTRYRYEEPATSSSSELLESVRVRTVPRHLRFRGITPVFRRRSYILVEP